MLRARNATPVEEAQVSPTSEARRVIHEAALDRSAREAIGGDPLALRRFLGAVAPIVRRACRGVMGREDSELEDVIQDCLIDIARCLPQFRFEGSVSSYVAKIAVRRAILCRQRTRARTKQQVAFVDARGTAPNADVTPDLRADLVRNLLDGLNEEQAKALLLRIALGHSIDEIASMTGVSVNTVKTRLRLAKNRLRSWLERSGEGRRVGG